MTSITPSITPQALATRLDANAAATEALMAKLLADTPLENEILRPKRLLDAMRYGSLNGGKRLRPFLVVESADMFDVPRDAALLAGAALECIHCYSLVHDDLPAMDNSDLRRGRPTAHKAFDDATAILAGEGRFGDKTPPDVAILQQMKTGALLWFGCIAGALMGQSADGYKALDTYGRALGEAFQIADDLLDVEGDAAALGKPAGADAALGKTTFVTQLGIDGAKQRVRDLLARADSALSIFGAKGDVLRAAARFVAERKN